MMKLRRLFTYRKLKDRSNRMKVLGDLADKKKILSRFIELAGCKYPYLYNVHPKSNVVFEITVDMYNTHDDFREFQKDLKTLCKLFGFELKSGYSGFDTPSYFFFIIGTDCIYWIDNAVMYDSTKYNEFINEYIKKYIR